MLDLFTSVTVRIQIGANITIMLYQIENTKYIHRNSSTINNK